MNCSARCVLPVAGGAGGRVRRRQYVLPVCSPAASGGGRSTRLNSYAEPDRGTVGCGDQIAWYLQTAQALAQRTAASRCLPRLFHIPLSEYNEAWDLHVCYGHKFEPVCCPLINTGFYALRTKPAT